MFTKKITDDDNFMTLSSSAQALYLHLSMSADDDGFCNQVSIAMFKAHASVQDLQALLEKRYIYQFENGVIVIKHWRMANALRKDRYTPTSFQEELSLLGLKDNGSYTWLPDGCQTVANCLPQDRLGQDNIVKNNNIYDENFEILWKMLKSTPYDRKSKVTKKRKKELYDMGIERTQKAIEVYMQVQDAKYYHKRDNFLNEIIDNYLDKDVSDFATKPKETNSKWCNNPDGDSLDDVF